MSSKRRQQSYDHRLVQLVQQTGDASIATRIGVPRSTARGWIRRALRPVTTTAMATAVADDALAELRARVARLERRNELLRSVLRILFALLKVLKPDLSHLRVPAPDKARLLRAIDRTRGVIGLERVLGIVGLSPSRLRSWRQAERGCRLDDESSCPKSSPTRLTAAEVAAVREMVTSPDLRHVSTGGLAVLAQRTGSVVASATTWYRLVRERGWRRPRTRVHPTQPTVGIRTSEPNQIWHIDTTLIRLLDHTLTAHAGLAGDAENDAGKMGEALEPVLRAAAAHNVALVLIHHVRKWTSGADPADVDLLRGSGNFAAKVDFLVHVTKPSDAPGRFRRRELHVTGRLDCEPYSLLIEKVLGAPDRYRVLNATEADDDPALRDAILEALSTEPLIVADLVKETERRKADVLVQLKSLLTNGAIRGLKKPERPQGTRGKMYALPQFKLVAEPAPTPASPPGPANRSGVPNRSGNDSIGGVESFPRGAL